MERTNNYNDLKPFRFWCQKVLPLVYDDSLSYYELLDKVIDYLNKTMEDVTVLNDDTEALYTAYNQLQSYVNNYFDDLDVQDEINAKLDQMAIDGTLSSLINPQIPGAVSAWLAANVNPVGSAVIVDSTLTIAGAAADAQATGNALNGKQDILTFDNTPTAGSGNPVRSFGIKTYVDGSVANVVGEIADLRQDTEDEIDDLRGDVEDEITDLKGDISQLNTATAEDVGKALLAKTVADGKVTEWEFGEAGDFSDKIGNLSYLVTMNKNNIVSAINEVSNRVYTEVDFPETTCRSRFIEAMQKKADKYGLDITVNGVAGFSDDSSDDQLATAKSMAKLYAIASGYDALCKIWDEATDLYIYSKGSITTRHLCHSTVFSYNDGEHYANSLTDYYDMLGGKTGTWSPLRMLGAVIKGPDDILLCGFVRRSGNESSSSNRWSNMKKLTDIAYALLADPSADISTLESDLENDGCVSAEMIKIPNGNALLYERSNLTDESASAKYDTFIYGLNNTVKNKIASCTKVLTAITALDYVSDLNEIVTLTAYDVSNQNGGTDVSPALVSGEKFTIRELLYALMMPSSNRAAQAIARHVGKKILNMEKTMVSINAVYTQTTTVIPETPLNSLKNDLVVTANFSDNTTYEIDETAYVLSGELTEGTSTITVNYKNNKTCTFNVIVTVEPTPVVPVVSGYDTVGSPVIDSNNRMTTSNGNFIKTPFKFDNDGKSWELRGKVFFSASDHPEGAYYDFANMVDDNNVSTRGLLAELSRETGQFIDRLNLFVSDTTSSWNIVNGTSTVGPKISALYDADIYFKLGWDGTNYYIAASADGINWNNYKREWQSSNAMMTGYSIAFGNKRNAAWGCCIYVDSLELTVDNILYWKAISA